MEVQSRRMRPLGHRMTPPLMSLSTVGSEMIAYAFLPRHPLLHIIITIKFLFIDAYI